MKFQITNKQKILFPKSKITKDQYIAYYRKIAKWILPIVKDRPITLQRFPEGIEKQVFFQKKAMEYYPGWIKTVLVKRQQRTPIKMPIINDLDSLLYIANQVGTIHIWLSKKDKLNTPDRLIFDLDPPKNDFKKVIRAAKDLKKLLDFLKLPCFVMTTGSKGLHIIIPIKREMTFDEVRDFARKTAYVLTKQYPQRYTIETRIEKRQNRVFIDYLRNAFAQTQVSPYSVRPIENAPIATPIYWEELSAIKDSREFNVKNIFKRKSDPFSSLNEKSVSLKNAVKKLEKFL